MKKVLPLLVCCAVMTTPVMTPVCLAAHSSKPSIQLKGGDGTSKEKAIIIIGATNSEEGVPAEYKYLDKKYPGHTVVSQGLLQDSTTGKYYDAVTILTRQKKEITIYFDISAFMGK